MSSALAIAGVSAVLRDLLNNGLIDHLATERLGVKIDVTVGPPDRVIPEGGEEKTQLNLFMYQVTPNTGWCNEGFPSRDTSGNRRLSNPPLALNLHYLISAHASKDFHGEILLGYAMQFLHETPVLSRSAIQVALSPSTAMGAVLLPAMKALETSGLESQIEQIKITPEYLNSEEMSKLWTATQSHLRPAAAYMASVVLIQAEESVHLPLPVLSRGQVIKPDPIDQSTWYEKGVSVQPGLVPPLPMLEELLPSGQQPVAQINTTIELLGHHLDAKLGTDRKVLLSNDRFTINETIVAAAPSDAPSIMFSIPDTSAAQFPVGVYSVGVRLQMPDEINERETNRLSMTLAPSISGLPMTVNIDGSGKASFTLNFLPVLRAGQSISLVLGQEEYAPQAFSFPASSLDFVINDAIAGSYLVRLRIDGIDSPIIDRSVEPPAFLNQRITIV